MMERSANPGMLPLEAVPRLSLEELGRKLSALGGEGRRLLAFFAAPSSVQREGIRLYALIGDDGRGRIELCCSGVKDSYPSFAPRCTQAHLFEREIYEQCSIKPLGHPWLKPVRRAGRLEGGAADAVCADGVEQTLFQLKGDEVHEVAVGPVHAGIIEPGHFRFQCHGEEVLHLEIALGYQHRGIEEALTQGPHLRSLYQVETAAGDSSVGHLTAYCHVLEILSGQVLTSRAQALRALALELERLANHTGDLGALAGDVAYLPSASYCGRIRGDFLNMTALVCGSRLGRGWRRISLRLLDRCRPLLNRRRLLLNRSDLLLHRRRLRGGRLDLLDWRGSLGRCGRRDVGRGHLSERRRRL